MDPIIGQIQIFGFNFAPRGWATCEGQLLQIAQNQALFSLLGTTYGGNGTTTFGLPDLRGRVPMHFGSGPGLLIKFLGESGGTENTTLVANNLPSHNHVLNGYSEAGTASSPAGAILANTGALDREYATAGTIVTMKSDAIGNTGGNQAFNNMQPYLVVNFCIALEGIYPSRN
jgi:microcystin-dependent protein